MGLTEYGEKHARRVVLYQQTFTCRKCDKMISLSEQETLRNQLRLARKHGLLTTKPVHYFRPCCGQKVTIAWQVMAEIEKLLNPPQEPSSKE